MPFSNGTHVPSRPSDTVAPSDLVLSTAEAASMARLSPRTITRLCASGTIKAHKVGRKWRILKADFTRQLGI